LSPIIVSFPHSSDHLQDLFAHRALLFSCCVLCYSSRFACPVWLSLSTCMNWRCLFFCLSVRSVLPSQPAGWFRSVCSVCSHHLRVPIYDRTNEVHFLSSSHPPQSPPNHSTTSIQTNHIFPRTDGASFISLNETTPDRHSSFDSLSPYCTRTHHTKVARWELGLHLFIGLLHTASSTLLSFPSASSSYSSPPRFLLNLNQHDRVAS
jgi:hypothetical protein